MSSNTKRVLVHVGVIAYILTLSYVVVRNALSTSKTHDNVSMYETKIKEKNDEIQRLNKHITTIELVNDSLFLELDKLDSILKTKSKQITKINEKYDEELVRVRTLSSSESLEFFSREITGYRNDR